MKSKFILLIFALMLTILNSSCTQVSEQKKEEAQALINEAGNLMMNNKPEVQGKEAIKKAIPLLKKSLEIDKTIPVAYEALINCYNQLGDHSSAIDICSLWLKDHPNDVNIHNMRGMLYFRTKDIKSSDSDFSIVAQSISKHNFKINAQLTEPEVQTLINLSFMNLIVGNKPYAISLLDQLKKALPKNKEINDASISMQNTSREQRIIELTGL